MKSAIHKLKFVLFSIFLCATQVAIFGCDPICLLDSKIDERTTIAEGRIVAITGNFQHPEVQHEFALLKVVVDSFIYSNLKSDTIHIVSFAFGAACELIGSSESDLHKKYNIGEKVSFLGSAVDLLEGKIVVDVSNCGVLIEGSLRNRIDFDFERSWKISRILQQKINQELPVSERLVGEKLDDFLEDWWDMEDHLLIPPQMQAQIILSKIEREDNQGRKMELLRPLLWYWNVTERFIENLDLQSGYKWALAQEFRSIRSEWFKN